LYLTEEVEEVVVFPSGALDLASDGSLVGVCAQEVEGDAPRHCDILGGVVVAGNRRQDRRRTAGPDNSAYRIVRGGPAGERPSMMPRSIDRRDLQ
jgi:hypothetical protein